MKRIGKIICGEKFTRKELGMDIEQLKSISKAKNELRNFPMRLRCGSMPR